MLRGIEVLHTGDLYSPVFQLFRKQRVCPSHKLGWSQMPLGTICHFCNLPWMPFRLGVFTNHGPISSQCAEQATASYNSYTAGLWRCSRASKILLLPFSRKSWHLLQYPAGLSNSQLWWLGRKDTVLYTKVRKQVLSVGSEGDKVDLFSTQESQCIGEMGGGAEVIGCSDMLTYSKWSPYGFHP